MSGVSRPGFDAVLTPWSKGCGKETVVMGPPSKYTSEFRHRAIEEVLDRGRTVTAVAASLPITTPETLRRWVVR